MAIAFLEAAPSARLATPQVLSSISSRSRRWQHQGSQTLARQSLPARAALGFAAVLVASQVRRTVRQRHRRSFGTAASVSAPLVDVHCHLTHEAFSSSFDAVVDRAEAAGLQRVVVNGLEPESNRQVLELCSQRPAILRAALGIYPLDACAEHVDAEEFRTRFSGRDPRPSFDIAAELSFIEEQASSGRLIAVGEAGLDGMYGYNEMLLGAQEAVLRELCRLAKRHDLPIILHSRAAEARTFRVLEEEGVSKADFHCYMGKRKLAEAIAAAGYYLSIPAIAFRNRQVQDMCKVLPMDRLLTETDSPYLSADRDTWPNEPAVGIPAAIQGIATAKSLGVDEVSTHVWSNYEQLFGK